MGSGKKLRNLWSFRGICERNDIREKKFEKEVAIDCME